MLKDAGRERDEMLARAAKEAEQLKAGLVEKARSDADQLVVRAKQQIALERSQAVLELRNQVADLAMTAAEKIVRSSLTPEAQKKLVDDTIAALPRVQ